MTNSFRKDVLVLLIISIVLTSFSAISLALHAYYPFDGSRNVVGYLLLAIYLFTFSLLEIYFAVRLEKYKAKLFCKIVGIYTFIFFPLLLVLSIFLGVLVPKEASSWNYYLVSISTGVNILYQLGMSIYISNRLIEKNKGYVVIKNICWLIIGVSSAIFLFYISGFIKALFIDLTASVIKYAFKPGFYITTAVEITLMIGLSFWVLYVGYSTFLSGIVNNLVDIKHNVKFTKRVYQKYHVSFYFSIIGNGIMFIIALVASFTFLTQYLSLVALYAALLLIKIPVHYYDRHIDKKYKDSDEIIFRKKHSPLIYSGIIFLIYAIIVLIFGSSSQGKNLDNKNVLVIYIIFVPYALFRLGVAISKYVKYRQSYNPVFLATFYADVVLAIFTVTNVVIMLGLTLQEVGWLIVARVLFYVLTGLCIIVSIYLVGVGICGLNNKRIKSYQNYLETSKAIKQELEEDD